MRITKKLLLVSAWLFATGGLALLAFDTRFFLTYGFDANEIAGISDGYMIDWPTGERPLGAMVPVYAYAIILMMVATTLFALRRRVGAAYAGRIWRGAE